MMLFLPDSVVCFDRMARRVVAFIAAGNGRERSILLSFVVPYNLRGRKRNMSEWKRHLRE